MPARFLLVTMAATVLSLSAGPLLSGPVEGAKPALVVGALTLLDAGDCMGTATWSGLHGGKALYIKTRLAYDDGTSVVFATEIHKVRQGEGELVVDYGSDVQASSTSLKFEVTFMTQNGDVVRSTYGTCD
jgi:hypothetical protein